MCSCVRLLSHRICISFIAHMLPYVCPSDHSAISNVSSKARMQLIWHCKEILHMPKLQCAPDCISACLNDAIRNRMLGPSKLNPELCTFLKQRFSSSIKELCMPLYVEWDLPFAQTSSRDVGMVRTPIRGGLQLLLSDSMHRVLLLCICHRYLPRQVYTRSGPCRAAACRHSWSFDSLQASPLPAEPSHSVTPVTVCVPSGLPPCFPLDMASGRQGTPAFPIHSIIPCDAIHDGVVAS